MSKPNKLKQLLCCHKYEFFPEKANGLQSSRIIRGFCPRCNKQVEFTHKEYKEYIEKHKEEE